MLRHEPPTPNQDTSWVTALKKSSKVVSPHILNPIQVHEVRHSLLCTAYSVLITLSAEGVEMNTHGEEGYTETPHTSPEINNQPRAPKRFRPWVLR